MFTLAIPSGYVLTAIFVVFDVLSLTVTDMLLTRIVCALYYRDINNGHPLLIRSLDIPGIVTYLLGNWLSFGNLLTFFIKCCMVTFVFFINYNVETIDGFHYSVEKRKCTYDFIPTDAEWNVKHGRRAVERREEFTRLRCREFNGDRVTFYRSVFNLDNNIDLLDETNAPAADRPKYGVNDSSLICLSPRYVRSSDVDPILHLKGCSRLGVTNCAASLEYRRTITAKKNQKVSGEFNITVGTGRISYGSVLYNKSDIAKGFPEYVNPSLHCLQQCFGVTGICCRNLQDTNCRKAITPCLIVAEDHVRNETLFERWLLVNKNRSTIELVRTHPGPIVEGVFNFSRNRANVGLLNVQTSVNWWEFAGVILTDSFVYRYAPQSYELKKMARSVFIPIETVVLSLLTIFIVVTGSIATWITLGEDERPKFNTINGLSSILREEHGPSGRSFEQGETVVLGLSRKTSELLHFGPVQSSELSMAASTNVGIE